MATIKEEKNSCFYCGKKERAENNMFCCSCQKEVEFQVKSRELITDSLNGRLLDKCLTATMSGQLERRDKR